MNSFLLVLTYTPHIGWHSIQKLINQQADSSCMNMTAQQWKRRFSFLTKQQTESLEEHVTHQKSSLIQKQLQHDNISVITIYDSSYPHLLQEIHTSPWLLFCKGEISLLQANGIAVVGSRKTTPYGRHAMQRILPEIVEAGWCIYSGLALGTDAEAHKITLQQNGQTIAVLGCGIGHIYPYQNRTLYDTIQSHGLLVSEYPPNTAAHPGFFPQRNRIIAGLTYGTVVIQAALKSGSLITAHHAVENGREVFALPGSIFDAQCAGSHALIQQGARLITSAAHILSEFEHYPLISPQISKPLQNEEPLTEQEQIVLALLENGQKQMNDLIQESKQSFPQLSHTLLQLELKKLIHPLPGSIFQKK